VIDRVAESTGCTILRYNGTWVMANGDKDLTLTFTPLPGVNVTTQNKMLELTANRLRIEYTDTLATWQLSFVNE